MSEELKTNFCNRVPRNWEESAELWRDKYFAKYNEYDALVLTTREVVKERDVLRNQINIVKEICHMYGNQIPLPCEGDLGTLAKYILNKLAEIEYLGKKE